MLTQMMLRHEKKTGSLLYSVEEHDGNGKSSPEEDDIRQTEDG